MASNGRIWRVKVKNAIGDYVTFAGVKEESMTHANRAVDVTDKESDGYRHQIPNAGRAVDFSCSGVAIDNQGYRIIKRAVRDNSFIDVLMESEFDRLTGSFSISNYAEDASHEGAVSFSCAFQSANAYNYQIPVNIVEEGVLDSTATFTRTSTATYFGSDGLLKTAAVDEARVEYDPATGEVLGLLIEEQRTNSLLHNRDLSNGVWSGAATQAKNAVGIDGVSNSAHTITDASGTVTEFRRQLVTIPNDSATHSVRFFIAKDNDETRFPSLDFRFTGGTTRSAQLVFNTKTGAFTQLVGDGAVSVIDKGDFWAIEISLANNASGNTNLVYGVFPAYNSDGGTGAQVSATGSVIYDFGQVELNASFATSPIETAASAVTRSAETPVVSDISAFYTGEGFSATFEGTPLAGQSNIDRTFWFYDSSSGAPYDEFITMPLAGGAGAFVALRSESIGVTPDKVANGGVLTTLDPARVTCSVEAARIAIAFDGVVKAENTDPSIKLPPGIDRLRIGWHIDGVYANAHIKTLVFYPRPLSNERIAEISAP